MEHTALGWGVGGGAVEKVAWLQEPWRTGPISRVKNFHFIGRTLGSYCRALIRRMTRSVVCFRINILVKMDCRGPAGCWRTS